MGQSTNAILAFGFDLGDAYELPEALVAKLEEHDGDIEALLLNHYGVELQRGEKLDVRKVPVEIIEHCSAEYPCYFLAVRGTKRIALRGHPQTINTSMYGVENAEKQRAMRDFCLRHDIAWQEPKWYIFSYWG